MAMTTSMTRSRRADGLHLPTPKIANGHRLLANAKDHYAPRPKRQLDAADRDFDSIVPKKARFTTGIAVEIPARPSLHARFAKDAADAKPAPAPPKPAVAAPKSPPSHRAPPANGPRTAPASAQQQPALTKHQEKVANGLKHELNRLQPNAADTKDQGRKLRSQEATRFKSELSAYFPEYDEVIGNDPKETHLLNIDTPIIITPDPSPPNNTDTSTQQLQVQQQQQQHHQPPHSTPTYPIRSYGDALYTDLFDAQRIDFSFLDNNKPAPSAPHHHPPPKKPTAPPSDPLPDTLFSPAHRKAERLERSIRNTEKGRAQHEKDQIIRLLDGLQGHDWLRVMGVSGITEGKKRAFEPAREHFIRGCEGILGKFRRWAREEKRRRVEMLERRAVVNEEGDEEGGEGGEEEGSDEEEDGGREAGGGGGEMLDEEEGEGGDEGEDGDVEGEPPDESDVDASIAKQLREEALAAAAKKKRGKAATTKRATATARGKAAAAAAPSLPPPPPAEPEEAPEPPREFTSFFSKRYQREAALSKNRRKGRKALAWGQPVPEMAEADFELPFELRDEDTLRSHARKKRRDKRVRST